MKNLLLSFIALALYPQSVILKTILLLGDSIDRITVHEWCSYKEKQGFRVKLTPSWCDEYEVSRNAHRWHCTSCQTDNDTIGSVHLFGSGERGPYHFSDSNDEYEPTKIRLSVMIPKFISLYGVPDRVMFHTSQWDARCGEFSTYKSIDKFRFDTTSRLDEILAIVGDKSDVGLRTAAWSIRGGSGIREYNVAIREMALQKNLTLYDFDHDIWSSVNHDFTKEWHLFRDEIHPVSPFPERAGEKLLGNRFTRDLKLGNQDQAAVYDKRSKDTSTMLDPPALWLDIFKNTTYFYDNRHHSWHYVPETSFLSALRLGPSDVREFDSRTDDKAAHLGQPAPTYFQDGTVFNITNKNELIHYRSSILMKLYGEKALTGLCIHVSDVIQLNVVDESWLNLLTAPTATISNAFDNKDDWVLKKYNSALMYLVRNCTRIRMSCPESLILAKKTKRDFVHQDNVDILPIYIPETM